MYVPIGDPQGITQSFDQFPLNPLPSLRYAPYVAAIAPLGLRILNCIEAVPTLSVINALIVETVLQTSTAPGETNPLTITGASVSTIIRGVALKVPTVLQIEVFSALSRA